MHPLRNKEITMAQNPKRTHRAPWLTAAALVVMMMALAACGSSSNDGGSAATAADAKPAADSGAAGGGVAAAKQRLEALYAGVTFKEPPASGPKPQAGKNIWLIDFGLAAAEGALVADGTKAAAAELGWKITVYDGKFEPARFLDGVRQAIAAKADGIFLYAVDCAPVKAALQQAKGAKIKVVGAESLDCGEGDAALYDGSVSYSQGGFLEWAASAGSAEADWAIAKTDGKASVINLFQNDTASTKAIQSGFVRGLESCPGCKVAQTVTFGGTELGPKLQEKVQQAILKNPGANVLMVPYDGALTAGVNAAVMASGRNAQLNVVAGGGLGPNMDLVRKDRGQDAGYSTSLEWEGWAALDAFNRLFNGQQPEGSGIGMQVFDKDHNMPASGPWVPKVDFVAGYKRAWKG
jgi:ribose transport system substrate-binding protein